MPRPGPSPRRAAALGAVAVLATSGLAAAGLVTAPSASAAPWVGQVATGNTFNYSNAGCSPSSGGSGSTPVALAANTPASLASSGSATGTGPTAPDTATMSASVAGSALVTEGPAGVTSFDVSADLKASATRALGAASACTASANALAGITGTFTTTTGGLLDLRYSNLGTGFAQHQITIIRTAPGVPSASVTFSIGEIGRSRKVISVQPGDYQVQVSLNAQSADSSGTSLPAADLRTRVHGDFKPAGLNDGAQSGTGSSYLTLPDALTCATHSVAADFTNKAGKKPKKGKKAKISKASFYVNGALVKKVKKPNKKTVVTLTGVPDDFVTVRALLKLRGKGTVTVERDYLPCS